MTKEPKKYSKFPWTLNSTELLITFYGENIKSFLNPCKVQTKLWHRVVSFMKEEPSIAMKTRECLTVSVAQRKWLSLQKEFKSVFYGLRDKCMFPFYNQMNQLFNDYAAEKLSSNDNSLRCNEVFEADVSAYVSKILEETGDDSMDISGLRCETSVKCDNKRKHELNQTYSAATKIRKVLAELPKDSISIQKARMKILQNTPFNRRYQLSTIIDNRNAHTSESLQSREHMKPFVKKRNSTMDPSVENLIIDNEEMSFEYQIEALNECDFSEISQPVVFEREMVKISDDKIVNSTSINHHESDSPIIKEVEYSILEVPSLEESAEVLRSVPETRISQKRLVWNEDIEGSSELQQVDIVTNEPPAWFKNFLYRYETDIKRIDDRMSAINNKLDKVLAEKSSSFIRQQRNVKQEKM